MERGGEACQNGITLTDALLELTLRTIPQDRHLQITGFNISLPYFYISAISNIMTSVSNLSNLLKTAMEILISINVCCVLTTTRDKVFGVKLCV